MTLVRDADTVRLVGRDAEQAALRALLAATPADRPPVVLVSGEAGVGKTALVEAMVAGWAVRRGRAGEWRAAAYDVLAQALRAGPTPASAPELAAVLPELGPPAGPVNQSLLAAALRTALGGGPEPVVVVLDDLQWADDDTLDLLPALADALRETPVLLVGCYRSDELPRGHGLRGMRAELRRRGLLTELPVPPLARADVRAMLGDAVPAAVAEAIADRAEGLPFAVEELAAAVDGGGAEVPPGIREAVLLRTGRLPAGARAVLEAAAVLGTEFPVDVALGLAGSPGWPEEPAGAGLLTAVLDGRAAFRHALTRDAVYADVPWSRRRALHRAAADALAAVGAPDALVAAHLVAARELTRARPVLLAAADGYRRVHAYRDAAGVLRTALEIWAVAGGADAERLAVVDALAECAEMCADHAEAVALLTELADGAADPLARAGARRRLALAYELLGQWDRALATREAAAAGYVAAGRPAEAGTERIAAAAHLRSAGSPRAALELLDLARLDALAADRADLVLRVDGLRGNLLARSGHGAEGVRAVQAALDAALAAGYTAPAAEIYQRLADTLEHAGDYRAATAAYASGYQFCDVHGQGTAGSLCRACVTAVLFVGGQWDRAVEICREVLDSAGRPHPRAVAGTILGLVQAMRGRAAAARPLLLEARSTATRIELLPVELLSAWGLAVLADAAGDRAGAAERTAGIIARWEPTEESHYTVPVFQWAATFFAGAGAGAQTGACAAALATIAERTAQPEARAALAHALGEAALLAGSATTAAAELSGAAAQFTALELPVAAVQSRHRAAVALIRAGDRDAALPLLRSALATAQGLRAEYLCGPVAATLSELGERPGRRRSRSTPGGLSGREVEVLRLVAMGRTSRQIATELFLSPRTVEMHVRNCMVKLDCRTRAEAVRRLAELGLTAEN